MIADLRHLNHTLKIMSFNPQKFQKNTKYHFSLTGVDLTQHNN